METPSPKNKQELLDWIRAGRERLEGMLAGLSEAQMVMPGPEGWSIKDHVAHLTAWELSMVALLQSRPRYAAMGVPAELAAAGNVDAINNVLFETQKSRPLPEVLADFRRTHQELLAALVRMSDEDLFRPYRYYQPEASGDNAGQPVVLWLAGDTYEHYAEHLEWMQAIIDQMPRL
ncbi:MAG: ClbS/DfsB family four-helix bundle protein [Chloroflexi bacterium]|nr:ClbS/DfsB family four-helix bundle protein [Anaerolineaceae bacterium]NMB90776.1 ClbS/DfsB family four-helix bundle protein [Chloroflexota bacterium]